MTCYGKVILVAVAEGKVNCYEFEGDRNVQNTTVVFQLLNLITFYTLNESS